MATHVFDSPGALAPVAAPTAAESRRGTRVPSRPKDERSFLAHIQKGVAAINSATPSEKPISLTSPAGRFIDDLVQYMANEIGRESSSLAYRTGRTTISFRDVVAAMSGTFSAAKSMVDGARAAAEQAHKHFSDAQKMKAERVATNKALRAADPTATIQVSENKGRRREVDANLFMSMSFTEPFLRKYTSNGATHSARAGSVGGADPAETKTMRRPNAPTVVAHVGQDATVALTAILQFLVVQVLLCGSATTRKEKRVQIKDRDIMLGVNVEGAESLGVIFKSHGIQFLGSGVVPWIHPNLIPSPERLERNRIQREKNMAAKIAAGGAAAPKRDVRFPGQRSLQDIRKQQASTNLVLAHHPFEKAVRHLATNYATGTTAQRFSGSVFPILQAYVEDQLIAIIRAAVKLAQHAKRDSINASDIELAWNFKFPGQTLPDGAAITSALATISEHGGGAAVAAASIAETKKKKNEARAAAVAAFADPKSEAAVAAGKAAAAATPDPNVTETTLVGIVERARLDLFTNRSNTDALTHRAGAKRRTSDTYECAERCIRGVLAPVLLVATANATHRRAQTVDERDVTHAIHAAGGAVILGGFTKKKATGKAAAGGAGGPGGAAGPSAVAPLPVAVPVAAGIL